MYGGIRFGVVAHAHVGVKPYTVEGGQGVVEVDETAFGAFEVVQGEGVRDASELEGVVGGVEGCGVEYDYAVPATLHGHWATGHHSVA